MLKRITLSKDCFLRSWAVTYRAFLLCILRTCHLTKCFRIKIHNWEILGLSTEVKSVPTIRDHIFSTMWEESPFISHQLSYLWDWLPVCPGLSKYCRFCASVLWGVSKCSLNYMQMIPWFTLWTLVHYNSKMSASFLHIRTSNLVLFKQKSCSVVLL